ncbi:MAG: hypothetical protein EXQ83_13000, partial [Xanthobacteraceae bacterium]|nr:hypothetical protein [Xanthobacteraceae bacterium]
MPWPISLYQGPLSAPAMSMLATFQSESSAAWVAERSPREMNGAALALIAVSPLTMLVVGGSHDPLLEWALRESVSGLASLPEGSESGLRRLARGNVMAAAIHMHRLKGDDGGANADAVANAPGLHDAMVIAFAHCEQGLLVAPGNPLKLT